MNEFKGNLVSKLSLKQTIKSLTSKNFSEMIEIIKKDITPMLTSYDEAEISELSLLITILTFLTDNELHTSRNVDIVKEYLTYNTDLTGIEINTMTKPDFLRFAIVKILNRKEENNGD